MALFSPAFDGDHDVSDISLSIFLLIYFLLLCLRMPQLVAQCWYELYLYQASVRLNRLVIFKHVLDRPLTCSYYYYHRTWNFDVKTTTTWSGGPGQILNIGGAPATFIACNESGSWALYLQQGTDVPDEGCVETQLQEGTTDV
ncbi:hypothetical protein FRB93_002414 [Tulasnella sp. JGI-2019a]|nr:hypothetical protein FRB93_002414 [Tulasnella sp. JGI-2019a]